MLILFTLADNMYSLARSLYVWIGGLYNYLISFTESGGLFVDISFSGFVNTVYVLAGVFMLFRVTVNFLYMIVDPDTTNDKQSSPSKILTRVIISIVLLIALAPEGFVFNYLDRLEQAIINPRDGLIVSLTRGITGSGSTTSINSSLDKYITKTNPFQEQIKDVNAVTNTCKVASIESNKHYSIQFFTFSSLSSENKVKVLHSSDYELSDAAIAAGYHYYPSFGGDIVYKISANSSNTNINIIDGGNWNARGSRGDLNSLCPKYAYINESNQMQLHDEFCGNCNFAVASSLEAAKDLAQGIADLRSKRDFAGRLLQTFIQCEDGSDTSSNGISKECEDVKNNVLKDDDVVIRALKLKSVSFNALFAFLFGIAVAVYLIVLCVEVIVRYFKLMLLQIISPIAIISYVNPKDKILSEWTRMYVATYLDLFLKLLAISIVAILINSIQFTDNLLKDFFIIIAILVFAKLIPTIINKIFGIDIASGTLKESAGLLKKGLGRSARIAGTTVARGVSAFANRRKFAKVDGETKGDVFKRRTKNALYGVGSVLRGATSGAYAGLTAKGSIKDTLAQQAESEVKRSDKRDAQEQAYQNYVASEEAKGNTPLARSDFIIRNKLRHLAGNYLGIQTEKREIEINIQKKQHDKGQIQEYSRNTSDVSSYLGSAIDSGSEKVLTHDSDGVIAREYSRNIELGSTIGNYTEEQWSALTVEERAKYVTNQEKTEIISSFSEAIKTDLNLKNEAIKDGRIKVDNGVEVIDGKRVIEHNVKDELLVDRVQSIKSVTDQNKRDGEIEYVISEFAKSVEDRSPKINTMVMNISNSLSNMKKTAEANYRLAATEEDRKKWEGEKKEAEELENLFKQYTEEKDYSNKTPDQMAKIVSEFKKIFKGKFDNKKGDLERQTSTITTEINELQQSKEVLDEMEASASNKK